MTQRLTFANLVLAACTLALVIVGASSLVATEVEVAAESAVSVCSLPTAELTADQVTFPITPEFATASNFLPGPLGIGCIPGGTCNADWQCGGPSRGYCKAVPGHCVCL